MKTDTDISTPATPTAREILTGKYLKACDELAAARRALDKAQEAVAAARRAYKQASAALDAAD